MGAFYELVYVLSVFVQLEINNVTETELGVLTIYVFAANSVELFPMTRLHEFGVELLDERSDYIHVLYTVVKGLKSLVVLDFFVLGKVWGSLARFHIFEEHLQVVGVDVVPESFLPSFELAVDDGDEIPHLLQLNQLIFAVNKLFLLGSLELEKLLKHLKLFGFFFHLTGL